MIRLLKGGFVLKANPRLIVRSSTLPRALREIALRAHCLTMSASGFPLVKEVHIDIIREGVTSWNLFEQGYRDLSGVSQTNYQEVIGSAGQLSDQMKRKGVGIVRDVAPDVHYFAFNMSDPDVGGYSERNRKLRQAVSLSIDAQQFLDLLYQGMGKPAQSIVAPGLFGYDKSYRNPYRQTDLVRAKRLLAEAGYPNGVDAVTGERFTLYFDNSLITPAGRLVIGLVVKQIEMLGIHVESAFNATARYLLRSWIRASFNLPITIGWQTTRTRKISFSFYMVQTNDRGRIPVTMRILPMIVCLNRCVRCPMERAARSKLTKCGILPSRIARGSISPTLRVLR